MERRAIKEIATEKMEMMDKRKGVHKMERRA